MEMVYREADKLVGEISKYGASTMVVSDHGMKQIGEHLGHHRETEGYWASSEPLGLDRPTLGQLYQALVRQSYKI